MINTPPISQGWSQDNQHRWTHIYFPAFWRRGVNSCTRAQLLSFSQSHLAPRGPLCLQLKTRPSKHAALFYSPANLPGSGCATAEQAFCCVGHITAMAGITLGHAAAPEMFPACRPSSAWWEMAQTQTFICHQVCCSFLQTILLNRASAAGSALSSIQLCLCFRNICHSMRLEADGGYIEVASLSWALPTWNQPCKSTRSSLNSQSLSSPN